MSKPKKKKRLTKALLINEIVTMLVNDSENYAIFIFDLVTEALETRTTKELKQILQREYDE